MTGAGWVPESDWQGQPNDVDDALARAWHEVPVEPAPAPDVVVVTARGFRLLALAGGLLMLAGLLVALFATPPLNGATILAALLVAVGGGLFVRGAVGVLDAEG